jgi:hypothetical protein
MGLERGPLSLVRIIEELLEWKSSGSGSRKPRLRPCGPVALTTRQLKLALTSPTGCGRSVGIVRLRTKKPRNLVFSLVTAKVSRVKVFAISLSVRPWNVRIVPWNRWRQFACHSHFIIQTIVSFYIILDVPVMRCVLNKRVILYTSAASAFWKVSGWLHHAGSGWCVIKYYSTVFHSTNKRQNHIVTWIFQVHNVMLTMYCHDYTGCFIKTRPFSNTCVSNSALHVLINQMSYVIGGAFNLPAKQWFSFPP